MNNILLIWNFILSILQEASLLMVSSVILALPVACFVIRKLINIIRQALP